MISSKSIRFHVSSNTYIIPKNLIFDQNVSINGNVIVGAGVRFWKNVKIFGDVQLGKGCVIEGDLNADNIIVGAQSKVKGNIIASGNVSLFQNSVARSIKSSESVTIMEGCFVGYADSKMLEIIGKADIKKIGAITKVTVRADTIALPEDEADDETEDKLNAEELIINEQNSEGLIIGESGENLVIGESDEDLVIDESDEDLVIDESSSDESVIEKEISKRSPLENNKIEQLLTQPPDSMFAEIMSGNSENLHSQTTPPFPLEQTTQKTDDISETSAKITNKTDSGIPKDELSDVEIFDGSEVSTFVPEEIKAQKTVETPFGTVVIDDDRASQNHRPSKDVGAELIIESKEDPKSERKPNFSFDKKEKKEGFENIQKSESKDEIFEKSGSSDESENLEKLPKSSVKPKPWPQFNPSSGKLKPETTNRSFASQIPSASKQNSISASNSALNSASKSNIQYDEIKSKNLPDSSVPANSKNTKNARNANNDNRKADSGNNSNFIIKQQMNQKIVFEEVESDAKLILLNEIRKPESGQKNSIQNQTRNQIQSQEQNQNEQEQSQKEQEQQKQKEQNKNKPADSERSKLWYEERFKQSPSEKKEYPPYI